MSSKFNLAIQTRKVIEKLKSISEDNPNIYSTDISDCITNAIELGTVSNSQEVSLYSTYVNFSNEKHYRFLYQIKTSVNGKIKNIDFVMSLIRDFEREFVYADKVNVLPEAGTIFVDILKKKIN